MKLPKDSKELLRLFDANKVDYVIVGAFAVAFHGRPRFTGDLDILLATSDDNARRVLKSLREFGFGALGVTVEDLTHPDRIVQLGVAPNRIDLITSLTGISNEEVWKGRVRGELDALQVWFVGLSELIRNKRATGRPQDLADAESLDKP